MQKIHKIFIAEDQTILRDLIARIFKNLSHTEVVGTSGRGDEAYEKCLELKPDIVVLDVMMPHLNGLEVLRRLKSKLSRVKVMMFSEACTKQVIQQAIKAGADSFLEKDIELPELEKAIDRIVAGESYFGPKVTQVMRDIMQNPLQDESLDSLTTRERQILQLIAEGHTSKEIAKALNISNKTADTHRAHIMEKLNLHNVAELTRYAISVGLTDKMKSL